MRISVLIILIGCLGRGPVQAQDQVQLENDRTKIQWEKTIKGYEIQSLSFTCGDPWVAVNHPSGEHTFLYSKEHPAEKAEEKLFTVFGDDFPGKEYRYLLARWDERTRDVALNTAGEAFHFYPDKTTLLGNQKISFEKETSAIKFQTVWELDPKYPQDILIRQTVEIKDPGHYSFTSPTLAQVSVEELEWATVPGYFHGNYLGDDLAVAYAYGNGVPRRPIVFSENTTSTLSPIISSK